MYWKGGNRLQWFEASGRGEVYTYVVAYPPFLPALEHLLPHIMVVVQLDEGPRMMTNVVGCAPDDVKIGMAVQVEFEVVDADPRKIKRLRVSRKAADA